MALKERYAALLEKCTTSLTTWKNLIEENCEGLDKDSELEKLQVIAQEYCVIDENHQRSENAIQAVEQTITDPAQNYNIDAMFKQKLADQPVGEPLENEIWKQLFSGDVSVQEIKPKRKKDKTEYEMVDDSLLCSSSFTAPVDPISKTIIHKPVINKKCKHVYDSNSIFNYIRQSKNKAKCPYMGCKNNKLVASDLQEDAPLEKKIAEYLESRANEDSEDDDTD